MLFDTRPKGRPRPTLAAFLSRLQALCNNPVVHPLPVTMTFLADATSHSGQPMAVYRCTYPGCTIRAGWVQDHRTGQPFRLWIGAHNSR
jgi:hypothetical protein